MDDIRDYTRELCSYSRIHNIWISDIAFLYSLNAIVITGKEICLCEMKKALEGLHLPNSIYKDKDRFR